MEKSEWKKIGRISRYGEALQITYHDSIGGEEHTYFIIKSAVKRLIEKGIPAEVSDIEINDPNTVLIVSRGTAARSKSGNALIINTPRQAGIMCPWSSLLKLARGEMRTAPLSITRAPLRREMV